MYEPNETDIRILKTVKALGEADIESISRKLPKIDAVPLRVKKLSTPEYSQFGKSPAISMPKPNTAYLVHSQTDETKFQITELGKMAIQEFGFARRQKRRMLWLKNAWIPIIVSILTTVAITVLKSLWPKIQELVSKLLEALSA